MILPWPIAFYITAAAYILPMMNRCGTTRPEGYRCHATLLFERPAYAPGFLSSPASTATCHEAEPSKLSFSTLSSTKSLRKTLVWRSQLVLYPVACMSLSTVLAWSSSMMIFSFLASSATSIWALPTTRTRWMSKSEAFWGSWWLH